MRCSHRRAVLDQHLAAWNGRSDLLARRDKVGLHASVARWSAAGEVAHAVGVRIIAVGGAHRNDRRGIAGIRDTRAAIADAEGRLSLIHISEPTRRTPIS